MRNLRLLDIYRDSSPQVLKHFGWDGDETCGSFLVPSPVDHQLMRIVASSDEGWDHVSVSRRNRPPNWQEMEHVKRMFFKDDETAMQLHVPPADHISCHPHCLHLWRPQRIEIPRPPAIMVGPPTKEITA
jgi:hypothetical protein